ncbi:glycosyltransferase family 9 protein [Persephonella sp.]
MPDILLFQPGALGDSFFTSALADLIKRDIPESRVFFYTTGASASMVKDNPNIDGFLIHSGNLIKDISTLRKRKFDYLLDTWAIGDAYYRVFFAKASEKIAIRKKDSEKYLVPVVYTKQVPFGRYGYVFWDRMELLRPLGIDVSRYIKSELPVYHISEEVKEKVKGLLTEKGLDSYVLLAPKGMWKTKDIPVNLAAGIVDILERDFGLKVVLSAPPSDRDYLEEIARYTQGSPEIITLSDIREFGALIYFSKHLISVESLPYHLAVGLRKSATVVLGGYPVWKPENYPDLETVNIDMDCKFCTKHTCPRGDYRCLVEITPEMIITKAERHLV